MPSSKSPQPARCRRVTPGERSERKAAEFYKRDGFDVLETNWRAGHKEIDLVVRKGDLLVFVEVKSSRTRKFGHPVEKVTPKKIQNLVDAATRYVASHDIADCDLRFDVVAITNGEIELFPCAFSAE